MTCSSGGCKNFINSKKFPSPKFKNKIHTTHLSAIGFLVSSYIEKSGKIFKEVFGRVFSSTFETRKKCSFKVIPYLRYDSKTSRGALQSLPNRVAIAGAIWEQWRPEFDKNVKKSEN
jgi:hypothetical protein